MVVVVVLVTSIGSWKFLDRRLVGGQDMLLLELGLRFVMPGLQRSIFLVVHFL